jgi:hypothetical protein
MIRQFQILALAALTAGAACDRQNNRLADSALNTDLSLAQQQRGYQPLDSLSLAERGLTATPNGLVPSPARTATTRRTTSSGGEVTTRRRTTRSSSGTTSGSTGSTTTTTTSGTTVEKHTKRDAAIGAAAGAVIGATTSRDKVKGAVIGGVLGGVLGGVIGNNVDVKKKKKP